MAIPAMLALAVIAGGCAAPAEPIGPKPDFRFDDAPAIALDVAQIEIHGAGTNANTTGDAGDAFVEAIGVPPEAIVRQWAENRLQAAGRSGLARFATVTASVAEDRLPRAKGAVGLFGSAPGARYTMTVEGRLEIVAADGQRAMASARVVRTKSLEGNRTPAERQRFWTALVTTTMAEFDSQMERAIRRHLNPWVL